MTVKQLKEALSGLNDDSIVTISQKKFGVVETVGYNLGYNLETNNIEIDNTRVVIRDYKIIN